MKNADILRQSFMAALNQAQAAQKQYAVSVKQTSGNTPASLRNIAQNAVRQVSGNTVKKAPVPKPAPVPEDPESPEEAERLVVPETPAPAVKAVSKPVTVNRADLRRAVILSEIIGTPKALQNRK